MKELHCYSDGYSDMVVADSKEDALEVWCAHVGENPEDYVNVFEQIPGDKMIKIIDGEDCVYTITEDTQYTEKTAAQWAKKNGRGFLCSSEC